MAKYTIKQGKHYSGLAFGLTFKDHISFRARFDASCLYALPVTPDYNHNYDINKLYGFSTTYNHHNQSARIGWRCLDGKTIELLTYTYNNHVRDAEDTVLGVVLPGEEFSCTITDHETYYLYTFTVDGDSTKVSKPKHPDKVWFKYTLKPYFGGDYPAPHLMSFELTHY